MPVSLCCRITLLTPPANATSQVATVDAASEPALSMKPSLSYNQLFGTPDGDSDKAETQDASTVSTAIAAGATESMGATRQAPGAATSASEKILKQTKHRLKTAKGTGTDRTIGASTSSTVPSLPTYKDTRSCVYANCIFNHHRFANTLPQNTQRTPARRCLYPKNTSNIGCCAT